MQRYTLVGDRRGWPSFEITAEMRPCDAGMWCSHDDHLAAIAAKDAEIARLLSAVKATPCNCGEYGYHDPACPRCRALDGIPQYAPHPDTARLDKLPAWQPMDSAPKDCNLLLARRDPPSVTYGHWSEPAPIRVGDCGGPCRCPEYEASDEPPGWYSEDGSFTAEDPPIAWMRPPEPPAIDAHVEPGGKSP